MMQFCVWYFCSDTLLDSSYSLRMIVECADRSCHFKSFSIIVI